MRSFHQSLTYDNTGITDCTRHKTPQCCISVSAGHFLLLQIYIKITEHETHWRSFIMKFSQEIQLITECHTCHYCLIWCLYKAEQNSSLRFFFYIESVWNLAGIYGTRGSSHNRLLDENWRLQASNLTSQQGDQLLNCQKGVSAFHFDLKSSITSLLVNYPVKGHCSFTQT